LGCLIIAVAMTIEEFSQIWIPNRTFDLMDLAANYLGISIAGWIRIRQKFS
jgi:polysaccharide biosynthesis protein VpsQ